MKKFKILCLCMTWIMLLAGCGAADAKEQEESVSFTAVIQEVNDQSVVVEALPEEQLSGQFSFGTADLDDIGAAVGDTVKVVFDGDIMETYPMQIRVSEWEMVEKAESPEPAEQAEPDENPEPVAMELEFEESTVVYQTDAGTMMLTLPGGWESEMVPEPEEEITECFGITFWPQEEPAMKVTANYYLSRTGICGTGVTAREITFENGLSGTEYTEESDGKIWMTFFYGMELDGSLMAEFPDGSADKELWESYEEKVLDILGTMDFQAAGLNEQSQSVMMPPDQEVSMEFLDCSEGVVTYRINNRSDAEYTFGEEIYLEKETGDNEWEEIPVADGYAWKQPEYVLKPSGQMELTFILEMFGELEPGIYRIWKNDDLGVEFKLTEEMLQ